MLSISDSPWLVKLLYSFQDPTYLYLAMVRPDRWRSGGKAYGTALTSMLRLGAHRSTCPVGT